MTKKQKQVTISATKLQIDKVYEDEEKREWQVDHLLETWGEPVYMATSPAGARNTENYQNMTFKIFKENGEEFKGPAKLIQESKTKKVV